MKLIQNYILIILKSVQIYIHAIYSIYIHVYDTWECASPIYIYIYIYISLYAAAKSLQSCPTLWDPIEGSPPGSAIPGILQARTPEWVAISFSNAWKWKVKVKSLSCVWLLVTLWTAAYQAPPSMGFSKQEYWSGVPLPSPIYLYSNRYKSIQLYIWYLSKQTVSLSWIKHTYRQAK